MAGEEAAACGRRLSGAAMGLIGAVGALGGLGINLAFRQSFETVGTGTAAFLTFLVFYGVCCAVTWAVYLRGASGPPAEGGRAAQPPPARGAESAPRTPACEAPGGPAA